MKEITISPATYHAVIDIALMGGVEFPFQTTGKPQKDGNWKIGVDEQLYERLCAIRTEDESFDMVIQKLLRFWSKQGLNGHCMHRIMSN